ncbi:MAG TPA: glycosyltransferase family 4 protein, partial [Thermoanaerobaculia bacterium]|nr:glycosyltransferase family 4 protein [Thermoanaerobaculia bacterium]
ASGELSAAAFVRFPLPYVSPVPIRASRWSWRKPVVPRAIVSPLGEAPLPEVVEEQYFVDAVPRDSAVKIVGSFDRPSVRNSVEQTLARIARFRTDVEWQIYRAPPSATELSAVDLWVDPAVDESDFDGFTAEAQVVGLPVVATRLPINVLRLEKGRTGFLTPPRDPNEMTHAILTALFKTEVAQSRQFAARQTVSKFRARQRLRILTRIYESLITTTQ